MTNHVHLLLTPRQPASVSTFMQSLGRRYVQYINHTHGRTGTLWEGRFLSSMVHAEGYLLNCMRYIELNPVRAGMVEQPGDYRWSSFSHNGLGRPDPMISEHATYSALGAEPGKRRDAYRALFSSAMDEGVLKRIREASQSETLLSGDEFRTELEKALSIRLTRAARGRPRKSGDNRRLDGQL